MLSAIYIILIGAINRLRGTDFRKEKSDGVPDTSDKRGTFLNKIFGRIACTAYLTAATWVYTGDLIAAAIIGLGFLAWCAPGWGLYFLAFSGDAARFVRRDSTKFILNKEIAFIDLATDVIFKRLRGVELRSDVLHWFQGNGTTPQVIEEWRNGARLWGAIAMTLRGLFTAAIFVPLGFYLHSFTCAFLTIPAALLQGGTYYAVGAIYKGHVKRWRDYLKGKIKKPIDMTVPIAEIVFALSLAILIVVGLHLQENKNPQLGEWIQGQRSTYCCSGWLPSMGRLLPFFA